MASTLQRIYRQRKLSSFRFCYLRSAPFVSTTSRFLCNKATPDHDRINFVMNGCDVEELQNVHHVQELVRDNLFVYDEFITPREEDMLHEELKTSLEKQSYQFDHWDNVSRISKPVNECCIFYPTSTPPC